MKRIYKLLSLILLSSPLHAVGGNTNLTVSSGTFLAVDLYTNATGNNRQAVVIGDRSSSATVTVDAVTGMVVQLATSSASGIGSLSAGSASLGNVNVISSNTLNVSQQGNVTLNALPAGSNSIGNVNITSTNTLNTSQQGNITLNALPAGSNSIGNVNINSSSTLVTSQSGTWSVGLTAGSSLTNSTFTLTNTGFAVSVTSGAVGLSAGSSITNSTFTLVTTTVGVTGMLSDNGAAAGSNRLTTLPAIYVSSRTANQSGTAPTVGRDAAMRVGVDGLANMAVLPETSAFAYSASTNTISVAASATDIAALCGNASNTVLLYDIRASCTQTTAGTVNLAIVKRSSAYTAAFSSMTVTPLDSNYSVVQSTAIWFTANPSAVGTLVGHLDNYKLGCIASATATPNDIYVSPASWRMKPVVLRGASQCVAINLMGGTVTGGAFTATFSWIEDPSL